MSKDNQARVVQMLTDSTMVFTGAEMEVIAAMVDAHYESLCEPTQSEPNAVQAQDIPVLPDNDMNKHSAAIEILAETMRRAAIQYMKHGKALTLCDINGATHKIQELCIYLRNTVSREIEPKNE